MSKPLGDEPIPKDYREFLSVNLRRRILAKFESGAAFHKELEKAGLKIERTYVYKWLMATRFPDIEHLWTIADILGVDVATLIPRCPRQLRQTIGRRTR